MSDLNSSQNHAKQPGVRFQCPSCQAVLRARKEFSGKKVKCSQCQQLLQVPGAIESEAKTIICICGKCKTIFQTKQNMQRPQQQTCLKCGYDFEISAKNGLNQSGRELRFQCQSCGQTFCVLSKYGGKKLKCLKCQQPMTIPVPRQETDVLRLVDPGLEIIEQETQYPASSEQGLYDPEEIPAGPAGSRNVRSRRGSGSRTQDGERRSFLVRLKIPLIIVAGIIGFVAGFFVVTSLIDAFSDPSATAVVQSPEAIDFTETIITQLSEKQVEDVLQYFQDEPVDELAVQTIARMLNMATLDNIESEVTYSNVEKGAQAYITRSGASFSDGSRRQTEIAFCVYEPEDWEEVAGNQYFLMSIKLLGPDGSAMFSAGQTDPDLLAADLDVFVMNNKSLEIPTKFICTILIVILIVALLTLISQISVFVNAGEPGWAVFVPIYREVCMARIADKSEGLGWLCGCSNFIPYVGGLVYAVLITMFSIGIARNYNRGVLFGLGLSFLPFVFYPILAFGGNPYD